MTERMELSASGIAIGGLQPWSNDRETEISPALIQGYEHTAIQQLLDAYPTKLHCKRQDGRLHSSLLPPPWSRSALHREQRALKTVARLGIRVPQVIYYGAHKKSGEWQTLLVTEILEGFISLDEWYSGDARHRWGARTHRQMLRQLGVTLSRLHRGRWQHGDCCPRHLLIRVQGSGDWAWVEIALYGLEKSCRRWSIAQASKQDLDQLYSHRQNMPVTDWKLFRADYDKALANPYGDA